MVTLSIYWYLCPQAGHIISLGEIGSLGMQKKVQEDWIIDKMLFDFFMNPKSRATDYKISNVCVMRAVFTPPGSYWDLILCSEDSGKTSFFLDWLFTPTLWTLSIISSSINPEFLYLYHTSALFPLPRRVKLLARELYHRLTDARSTKATGQSE